MQACNKNSSMPVFVTDTSPPPANLCHHLCLLSLHCARCPGYTWGRHYGNYPAGWWYQAQSRSTTLGDVAFAKMLHSGGVIDEINPGEQCNKLLMRPGGDRLLSRHFLSHHGSCITCCSMLSACLACHSSLASWPTLAQDLDAVGLVDML